MQQAKLKGMSIRRMARELGIHRDTVRRYIDAKSPPTRRSPTASTASLSDTMADQTGDIVSLGLWNHSFTGAVPGAADRSDIGRNRPSKSEGRRTLPQQSPNGCLGQRSPHFARPGQYYGAVNMQEEVTYVGIDIAKERVDVAIRPSGRSWSLPYDEAECGSWLASYRT